MGYLPDWITERNQSGASMGSVFAIKDITSMQVCSEHMQNICTLVKWELIPSQLQVLLVYLQWNSTAQVGMSYNLYVLKRS